MSERDTPALEVRVAGLELSPIAAWVLDPDQLRFVWANAAAIEMWRAPNLEELRAREIAQGPKLVMTRLEQALKVLRDGGALWQEWTFFPKGVPVRTRLHFAPFTLDDGRLGILQHAYARDEGIDPEQLRGLMALNLTSVIVALVDFDGRVELRNPAGLAAFGDEHDWRAWIGDRELAAELLAKARAGETVRRELAVMTTGGERYHAVELQPIRDTVSGEMMALIHHADQSARREAEAEAARQQQLATELRATLSLVDRQRREIIALAAPILEVAPAVLAVPVIGALDGDRGADIEARLLTAIRERAARSVIVDLTGADATDAATATRLGHMTRAARLIGARTIVTGLRPRLAAALAEVGWAPSGTSFARTLAEGIRMALASDHA
ncbi:MAG: PAS domain-containing protein [Myxococcales bacterium]|nr:PAS domain-containing protein [Myxococcales bacterium]